MHKILVVDDEKSTLSMFRLFLSAYGYTVLTAENGTEGLQLFEKEKSESVQIIVTMTSKKKVLVRQSGLVQL